MHGISYSLFVQPGCFLPELLHGFMLNRDQESEFLRQLKGKLLCSVFARAPKSPRGKSGLGRRERGRGFYRHHIFCHYKIF